MSGEKVLSCPTRGLPVLGTFSFAFINYLFFPFFIIIIHTNN